MKFNENFQDYFNGNLWFFSAINTKNEPPYIYLLFALWKT